MKKLKDTQLEANKAIHQLGKGEKLLIEAEGGAGKTTTIAISIIQLLRQKPEGNVALVAPTHIAKMQIFSFFQQMLIGEQDALELLKRISIFTTAGFAGRFLREELSTGLLHNGWQSNCQAFHKWLMIVIDEISITPRGDLKRIMFSDAPIVMSGDRSQCQPAKQKLSPVFTEEFQKEFKVKCITIEGNQRNDGQIRQLAKQCRNNTLFYPADSSAENTVYESPDQLVDAFLSAAKEYQELGLNWGTELCFMAFTNKRVRQVQRLLRSKLFKNPNANWQTGEYIRAKALNNAHSGSVWRIKHTSQLVAMRIMGCKFELKQQPVLLENEHGDIISANLLPFSQLEAYDEAIGFYQKAGDEAKARGSNQLANDFWQTRSLIAQTFEYADMACCITLLRSQSRTISRVWVDTRDVHKFGTNRGRLLYTAYSRASEHLSTVRVQLAGPNWALRYRNECKAAGLPYLSTQCYKKRIANWEATGRGDRLDMELQHINWWIDNRPETIDTLASACQLRDKKLEEKAKQ